MKFIKFVYVYIIRDDSTGVIQQILSNEVLFRFMFEDPYKHAVTFYTQCNRNIQPEVN